MIILIVFLCSCDHDRFGELNFIVTFWASLKDWKSTNNEFTKQNKQIQGPLNIQNRPSSKAVHPVVLRSFFDYFLHLWPWQVWGVERGPVPWHPGASGESHAWRQAGQGSGPWAGAGWGVHPHPQDPKTAAGLLRRQKAVQEHQPRWSCCLWCWYAHKRVVLFLLFPVTSNRLHLYSLDTDKASDRMLDPFIYITGSGLQALRRRL